VYDSHGQCWDEITDLLERAANGNVVDIPVEIGARDRLPGRLVAVRAPQEVVDQRRRRLRKQARATGTTVGKRRLALCAWTIFLTNVPADRLTVAEILTLARARWQIELLVQNWLFLVNLWAYPDRSLMKAAWALGCQRAVLSLMRMGGRHTRPHQQEQGGDQPDAAEQAIGRMPTRAYAG
jgi:hypothetical protein